MIVTAVLSLSGVIHGRRPAEGILFAKFFIGVGIGVYFVGVTWRELSRDVAAGAAYVVVLPVLAAAISFAVAHAGLAHGVDAFLAFAAGGQAEMTVLAIVAGADLGYVIAHHLTRIVFATLGATIVAGLLDRRGKAKHPKGDNT